MNRIVPVVIAVIYDKATHKFLLTQRNEIDTEDAHFGHCWNFPGGGLEFGETPEEGLRREIKEELGVDIDIVSLVPAIFSPIRNHWQGILICYVCTLKNESQKISLNDESLQYDWFTLDQIKKLPSLPFAYEIAEEAYRCVFPKRS